MTRTMNPAQDKVIREIRWHAAQGELATWEDLRWLVQFHAGIAGLTHGERRQVLDELTWGADPVVDDLPFDDGPIN